MVPVHEIVIILYSCGSDPQLTITAGKGYIIVPGFHSTFPIFFFFKDKLIICQFDIEISVTGAKKTSAVPCARLAEILYCRGKRYNDEPE